MAMPGGRWGDMTVVNLGRVKIVIEDLHEYSGSVFAERAL